MKIEIKGRVASKKNGKRIIFVKGRRVLISSKAWLSYEKDAITQIKNQFKTKKTLKQPYDITYIFYMRGEGNIDLDNMIAGINDCLEKSGVIENDRYIISGSFNKIIKSKEYLTILEIAEI